MLEQLTPVNAISEAIRLAIAPVFLLTGIGAILSVLTVRLGRVVDRARRVERRMAQVKSDEYRALMKEETGVLWRRTTTINRAMRLAVGSALLISLVIVSLFVGAFGLFRTGLIITVLFVTAMLLLIMALLLLLLEVSISTRSMLQSVEHLMPDEESE